MSKVDEPKKEATIDYDVPTDAVSPEVELRDGENNDDNQAVVSEIDTLNLEIAALKDEILRSRAEVENVRKRAEKDVAAAHKYGIERLIQDILPVKDSMDMGLEVPVESGSSDAFREGMELTAKMFSDFFEKLNVTVISPLGDTFDPELHQAMMTEPTSEAEKGTVTKVMQQGYLLNDRLVRPALVVVAEELNDAGD
jgi:molecular chaperone GrpE